MRIISLFFSLWFAATSISNSQTVSFDIARFTPPKGWTKDDKGNILSYTVTNQVKGTYCILGIYKSINSSGDLRKDFRTDWDTLVAKQLGISGSPLTVAGEPKNGFDALAGKADFSLGKSSGLAVLTSFSDRKKVFSIVLMTNDTAYFSEYRSFYKSLQLEGNPVSQTISTPAPVLPNSSTVFGDYIFSAPAGWKTENRGDAVFLRGPDNSSVITVLPMIAPSATLENEMEQVFWQVFPGWEPDARNPDHHIFTKGISPSGWEYYKKEIAICRSDNKNVVTNAFVMLVRLNNRDAVIAGSYANGADLLDEDYKPDWIIFYHTLDFKNFPKTKVFDLSKEILGTWSGVGSSAVSVYTFASNGRYSTGSAYSSSVRITDYTVKETTTSFGGEGGYKVDGNLLTMINDSKRVRSPRIRIFYKKDYGDWYKYLGMMDISSFDGSTYEIELRSDQK
jgi:hypothetical protein